MKKKNDIIILAAMIAGVFCLVSCMSRERLIFQFPDPFLASFYNKDIRNLVVVDKENPTLSDSIWFDVEGNMICKKNLHFIDSTFFDNHMRKRYHRCDRFGNTVLAFNIEYKFKGSEIDEIHYPENGETTTENYAYIVRYKLNDLGLIISAVDQQIGTTSIFTYDNNKRLILKVTESLRTKTEIERIKFYYDAHTGSLTKIVETQLDKESTYNFTNGLVDFIVTEGNTKYFTYFPDPRSR